MCYIKLYYFELRFHTLVLHLQKKQKWMSFISEFPVEVYLREKNTPKQDINSNPPITLLKWISSTFLGVQLSCKDKLECIGCQSKADQLKLGLRGARPQINEGKVTEFSFFIFLMYSTQKKSLGLQYVTFHFNAFPPPDGLDKTY